MNPQNRKYYAIVVHYGDDRNTDRTVYSLRNGRAYPDRIVVVDHGKNPYKNTQVKVVMPLLNAGYAAGLNLGLGVVAAEGAQGNDIVVCMNNDLEIPENAFWDLRRWWKENPADALLGFATCENGLVKAGGCVNLFTGRAILAKNFTSSSAGLFLKMPYAQGSFLAAPYRVFMRCGGWPEEYFMYWEDILFSARAARLGIPLRIVESIPITHRTTDKTTTQKTYYLVRNGAMFMEKETGSYWQVYWWLLNRMRFVWHSLNPSHRIVAHALWDAISGKTGKYTPLS